MPTRFTISGTNERTLHINTIVGQTLPMSLQRQYRVIVSNLCDTIVSAPAQLTINLADMNCDDTVDLFDLLVYLDLWFDLDPNADLDGVPGIDVFDLLVFLDEWFELRT